MSLKSTQYFMIVNEEKQENSPLNLCLALRSTCCVCAISFKMSWITNRSYEPASLGALDSKVDE